MGRARQPTTFEARVYAALRHVPRGRIITYKQLAGEIGCASPRAVGQALKRNPYAPGVPCHRVIAADLTLGGFCGATAGRLCARKRAMLAKEGVLFRKGRLADPALLVTCPRNGDGERRRRGRKT